MSMVKGGLQKSNKHGMFHTFRKRDVLPEWERCKWCNFSESTRKSAYHSCWFPLQYCCELIVNICIWQVGMLYKKKKSIFNARISCWVSQGIGVYLSMPCVWLCVCLGERHCKWLCSAPRLKALYKCYGKYIQRFCTYEEIFHETCLNRKDEITTSANTSW